VRDSKAFGPALSDDSANRPRQQGFLPCKLLVERLGVSELLAAEQSDFDAYGLGDRARFIDLPEEN